MTINWMWQQKKNEEHKKQLELEQSKIAISVNNNLIDSLSESQCSDMSAMISESSSCSSDGGCSGGGD